MSRFRLGHAAALGLTAVLLVPLPAAAQGKLTVETIEYAGWKNNLRLSNGAVELIATLDVGPRVLVYRHPGGKNVLKEYREQLGKSGEKEWQIRGGHRLWTAPEDLTRTYALDNRPVAHQQLSDGTVRLMAPDDSEYGIRKEIDLKLDARGSRVRLVHRITNLGDRPTTLAPWALTVMAPGGKEIIPLPAKRPHPGPPANAKSPEDYAANQQMVLWPFFDFKDPRWSFGSRYITLQQDARRGPTKIGLAHQLGWVGYLNDGTLFVKRLAREPKRTYPDRGCNFETFTNEDMLEIESLGPVVELKKGASTELVETWTLHKLTGAVDSEAAIDRLVLPLLERKMGKP